MLSGYKTYIGLGITLLGALGLGSLISEEEAGKVVNLIIELIGLGVAVYGRIKAVKKSE